jgi:hypothetical protein
MKTLLVAVVMLFGSTMWSAAQSCPTLSQYLPPGDVCSAPANQIFWYYYLGDETDTYLWSVTGGTIIGGGGHGDWFVSVLWTPGATLKAIGIVKISQWGIYCSDELVYHCP